MSTPEEIAQQILIEKTEPELDADGYAVGDPYAEAAKMIDRQQASKNSLKGKMVSLAKTIIDNKEKVTAWEKIIKSMICIGLLIGIVIQSGALQEEDARVLPDPEVFTALGNKAVIWDFFSRDGAVMITVVVGYLCARKYNEHLDEIEYKMYLEQKQQKKAEKMANMQKGKELGTVEEGQEESSDEESDK